MSKHVLSEQRYVDALESLVRRGVADSVRLMLAAHAKAPGRVATFRSLGRTVGFSQRNTNRIYGQFAGRMRRALRLPAPNIEVLAISTAPAPPIDAAEEFSFRMRPAFARALARVDIAKGLRAPKRTRLLASERQRSPEALFDGAIQRSQSTRWERNREARRQCIEHFGTACQVCGLSFGRRYGVLGADFIEVHHSDRHARRQRRRQVDPTVDLVPVCSNCHRMLHRREPPLGVRDLKKLMGRAV